MGANTKVIIRDKAFRGHGTMEDRVGRSNRALLEAACCGDRAGVEAAIAQGADINVQNPKFVHGPAHHSGDPGASVPVLDAIRLLALTVNFSLLS